MPSEWKSDMRLQLHQYRIIQLVYLIYHIIIQHIVPLIRIELICQPINLSTPYESEGIQRYGQSRRLSRNLLPHRRYASVRVLKYTFIC